MSFDLTKNMPHGIKANFAEAKSRIEGIENLKGVANGYAELDNNGFVPLAQLPAGVKDSKVVEDITARDAIASDDRFEGLRVHVLDATTGDSTVANGGAGYILKSGLTNSDWEKIYEAESLDLDTSSFFVIGSDNSDNVQEGVTNLYFTDQRAQGATIAADMTGTEDDKAGSVADVKAYVAAQIAAISKKYVNKSATGNIEANEAYIYANIASADITLTLPSVGSVGDGESHLILNKSTSTKNIIVVASGSDTVEDGANFTLSPGEYVEFIYEHSASNWFAKH